MGFRDFLRLFHIKGGRDSFGLSLRSAVRGLWTGNFTRDEFVTSFGGSIERRLTQAWLEGAAQCGIKPDELTRGEIDERQRLINGQLIWVPNFADDIEADSRANGGAQGPLIDRVPTWVSQYDVARTQGDAMACGDVKKMWVIDPFKDNCNSCLRLNGKVKRNSFWHGRGILPQVNGVAYLICGGYE